MVYLWAGALFIFLFTVPKQETPEEKVWRELEESVVEKKEKPEEKKQERYRIGDIDWKNVNDGAN